MAGAGNRQPRAQGQLRRRVHPAKTCGRSWELASVAAAAMWLYEDSESRRRNYEVLAWLFWKDYLPFKVTVCSPG
ncbi:hypothetical protein AV530_003040 [Patagioenas fasciata monilis]|uniref:Uncharacterized protein n=1 Tax=Patagioenas fasciata monilis TaxID=372326 RepID=A0A1V4KVG8_PATFA|nr:hypothetical protein AV530_003040 [Patagioenas fasciata monilis]